MKWGQDGSFSRVRCGATLPPQVAGSAAVGAHLGPLLWHNVRSTQGRRGAGGADMASMSELRKRMVARHVVARGIRDPLVLKAMETVAREAFLPRRLRNRAYADAPLPIGKGQTISQPYIVAFMVEALQLKGGEVVLEIGAGSGYAAAVLAEVAREVYAVERIAPLAEKAARTLTEAGYANVHIRHADGTQG